MNYFHLSFRGSTDEKCFEVIGDGSHTKFNIQHSALNITTNIFTCDSLIQEYITIQFWNWTLFLEFFYILCGLIPVDYVIQLVHLFSTTSGYFSFQRRLFTNIHLSLNFYTDTWVWKSSLGKLWLAAARTDISEFRIVVSHPLQLK